jgi:curved DNA-binding protein CbpA
LVKKDTFVDLYEVLQISPNAGSETIERVYRMLAKRYHPDNQASGDAERFREVREAYEILVEPERRAAYDVQYDENKALQLKIFDEGLATGGREEDQRIFHGVLSLLYVARRRNPASGGLGTIHLEKMLGVPREHLEFPLWYLKQRGWIQVLDTGEQAITVEGIDTINTKELSLPDNRLLSESRSAEEADSEGDVVVNLIQTLEGLEREIHGAGQAQP